MLKIKPGVDVSGIRPEIMLAVHVAEGIFGEYETVITSVRDGRHSVTSLHYAGQAVDFRTRHLPPDRAPAIAERIKAALTEDFDVILEADHIHVEYQPRRRSP